MSDPPAGASRLAFAFPGVGVPLSGHERPFFERHQETMAPFLDEASLLAGADVGARLAPDARPLQKELHEQLFTVSFSCGVAATYRRLGREPSLVGGHSMGIYGALVASGALSFVDGLAVTKRAYELVTELSTGRGYGMAVVVGLGDEELAPLLAELPTVCLINSNNETSKVLAGRRDELEQLVERALGRDAYKAAVLDVGAPYHHPEVLPEASRRLRVFVDDLRWRRPRCPLVSTIDQRLLDDVESLKQLTADNLSTPIHWERVVGVFGQQGIELVAECGPGLSLTQNGRMIAGSPRFVSLKGAARRLGA